MPRDRSRERSPRDRRRDSRRDLDRDIDRDRDRNRSSRARSRDRDQPDRNHDSRSHGRDRDRDRHRDRDHEGERSRHRGEKPRDALNGKVSEKHSSRNYRKSEPESKSIQEEEGAAPLNLDADISPEEMQMMQAMGIPFGFDTTQGQHVEDDASNQGGVKVKQTRRARQYMNRRGGFNRALPAERTGTTALRD